MGIHLSFGREFRIKSHYLRISGPFLREWEAQGIGFLVYTAHKARGEPVLTADSWQCPQRFPSQWVIFPTEGHISKSILNHTALWRRTALKVTFYLIGWVSSPWCLKQAPPLLVCACVFWGRWQGREKGKENRNLNSVSKWGGEQKCCQLGPPWLGPGWDEISEVSSPPEVYADWYASLCSKIREIREIQVDN